MTAADAGIQATMLVRLSLPRGSNWRKLALPLRSDMFASSGQTAGRYASRCWRYPDDGACNPYGRTPHRLPAILQVDNFYLPYSTSPRGYSTDSSDDLCGINRGVVTFDFSSFCLTVMLVGGQNVTASSHGEILLLISRPDARPMRKLMALDWHWRCCVVTAEHSGANETGAECWKSIRCALYRQRWRQPTLADGSTIRCRVH